MIGQTGKIGVRQGRWHRLTFWAKAQGITAGAVEIGLVNTRAWTHYSAAVARPVRAYQIVNEPVYTSYSLPREFGCSLDDCPRLLPTAARAMSAPST